MSDSQIINLVSIVVLHKYEDKILLGKRLAGNWKGYCATPGGKIEFMETAMEAALRELYEETKLKVKSIHEGESFYYIDEKLKRHYHITPYITYVDVKKVQNPEPDKCSGWFFYDLHKLPIKMTPITNQAILSV